MISRDTYAKTLLSLSIVAAASGHAYAATQGTAGATSNGSSIVTISKLNNVQVSAIDDIDLGTQAFLVAPAVGVDDICVFSSNVAYQITFDQAGGSFELAGATSSDTIPYTVQFGLAPATAGTPITGQVGNRLDPECLGVPNAVYTVTVAPADFNAAAPDSYRAVLELLVEAE